MTIIHSLGTLNTGGIQKFILQLSQSPPLKRYKHQVLCTIQSIDNYKDEYEKNNIIIHHLPFTFYPKSHIPYRLDKLLRYFFSKLYIFRLWYYLIKSEADILHSHIHSHIISQILAAVLSGKKMIWTIHGEYSLSILTIFFLRALDFILSDKKFRYIADSISALHSTLPFTVKNHQPDNIIPTGINLKPYLQEYNQSLIREKYNIKDNTILIGSTGRIVWQKGYDQLLSLLENYDFGEKIFHILIAGDGSLRNKFIKRIGENKLESYITFIGNIKNIPEFLSALDIYIQPSVTEGFPLSVLEAMASKLPIISSNAGGLKEMIIDGENGMTYESGDISNLDKTIHKMLNLSIEDRKEFGSNAYNCMKINNSIEKVAEKYKAVYFQ